MKPGPDARVGDKILDLKTLDLAALEPRVAGMSNAQLAYYRQLMQQSNHAAKYGVGPGSFLQGAKAIAGLHDGITFKGDQDEFIAAGAGLSSTEWCWAVAFRKALGVGSGFYEGASYPRRRWLEQHYIELANHDTQKGRRAAKVVKAFVQYKLSRGSP